MKLLIFLAGMAFGAFLLIVMAVIVADEEGGRDDGI